MKNKILIVFLLYGSVLFAQEKNIKKLEKLYSKNNVEKGMLLSFELKKENPRSAVYHYYNGLFNLQKSELAKSNSYKRKYFNVFIRQVENGLKLDSGNFLVNKKYFDFVYVKYKKRAENLSNTNSNRALKYHKNLATYFFDTTSFYRQSIIKEIDEKLDVQEKLAYSKDSIAVDRQKLISFAESLVGTPYKYGGESSEGLDCSGFNLFVYKNSGIKLPHNAHMQSKLGRKIPINKAKEGDLIFFGSKTKNGYRASHAGMVYKNNEEGFGVIHCVSRGVSIDTKLWESYWSERVLFVKRIIE